MNIQEHNRAAWDRQVNEQSPWTIPVSPEEIARARNGDWSIVLTPTRPVPSDWFPESIAGADILCLAGGGGQQGPILAAAGANVTVFDNSPAQLKQDRFVAERENLSIHTIQGDMQDLSEFREESFDLIFHPCSNCFVPDVLPVWREAFRVLRPGGRLLSGVTNPVWYLFDEHQEAAGNLVVRHRLPYSDLTSLNDSEREDVLRSRPLEFGHTLTDLIGGQLQAGFVLEGFYEDRFPEAEQDLLSQYLNTFIATKARKPE